MAYRVPVLETFDYQPRVIDKDLSTPPLSPSKGNRYIVGPAATGTWSGQENNIMTYSGTEWLVYVPFAGSLTYVIDEDSFYRFDGTEWIEFNGVGILRTISKVIVVTESEQTVFDCSDIWPSVVYCMAVYVNGLRQLETIDYIKDPEAKTVTLLVAARSTDAVLVEFNYFDGSSPESAGNIDPLTIDSGDLPYGRPLVSNGLRGTTFGDEYLPLAGGTITGNLTVNGSLLLKSGNPWVDVKAFGALGDGTTDDIESIQSAIDSLSSTGGLVLFPKGTYCVSTPILLPSNIVLIGTSTKQTTMSVIKPLTGATISYLILSVNFETPDTITNTAILGLVFDNDLFTDLTSIRLVGDTFIDSCIFKNIQASSINASYIYVTGGSELSVTRCKME